MASWRGDVWVSGPQHRGCVGRWGAGCWVPAKGLMDDSKHNPGLAARQEAAVAAPPPSYNGHWPCRHGDH